MRELAGQRAERSAVPARGELGHDRHDRIQMPARRRGVREDPHYASASRRSIASVSVAWTSARSSPRSWDRIHQVCTSHSAISAARRRGASRLVDVLQPAARTRARPSRSEPAAPPARALPQHRRARAAIRRYAHASARPSASIVVEQVLDRPRDVARRRAPALIAHLRRAAHQRLHRAGHPWSRSGAAASAW